MSRITALRTIRISERPNLIWVELETDEGLCGLGESFRGAQAVEAVLHEQVAPWLIGRDARQIEAVSRYLMTPYLGFSSTSAEVRAASAVDIALWDLAGQRHGIPSTRRWAVQRACRSAPTTPVRGTPTTRPGSHGATCRPVTRRLVPMTIRSPSCAMPALSPRACWRKASRP